MQVKEHNPNDTMTTHIIISILLQIEGDALTKTARENWAAEVQPAFKPGLVASIYKGELGGGKEAPPKLRRVMLLEISQYLEKYLIPNFSEVSSPSTPFVEDGASLKAVTLHEDLPHFPL